MLAHSISRIIPVKCAAPYLSRFLSPAELLQRLLTWSPPSQPLFSSYDIISHLFAFVDFPKALLNLRFRISDCCYPLNHFKTLDFNRCRTWLLFDLDVWNPGRQTTRIMVLRGHILGFLKGFRHFCNAFHLNLQATCAVTKQVA